MEYKSLKLNTIFCRNVIKSTQKWSSSMNNVIPTKFHFNLLMPAKKYGRLHIMTNHRIIYDGYWTNNIGGVAFTKNNYIENA